MSGREVWSSRSSLGCGQPFLLGVWSCLSRCFLFTLFTKQEIISLQHIAYEPGLTLHHLEAHEINDLNLNNSGINVWP